MSENPLLFSTAILVNGKGAVYATQITLRDLLAAFALAGFAANPNVLQPSGLFSKSNFAACYDMANAMLAERERRGKETP